MAEATVSSEQEESKRAKHGATAMLAPTTKRRRIRAGHVPWTLALPAIVLLVIFHVWPTASGAYYSFTDWNGISADANFIGLKNFERILTDPGTRGALIHTLQLTVAFVIFSNLIGLALAVGLHSQVKTRNLLRSLFFLPVVISPIAVSFVWQYVLDRYGILNEALSAIGLDHVTRNWLASPDWALWAVLLVMVWQYAGLCMVIYIAGLENIPSEMAEAAAVDGAGPWRRFTRITLPLLAPAVTIAMTMTLIFGLRTFDQIVALTGGGPVDATETLATQVWKQTFSYGDYGRGAALALILTALIAILSITQTMILRAREVR